MLFIIQFNTKNDKDTMKRIHARNECPYQLLLLSDLDVLVFTIYADRSLLSDDVAILRIMPIISSIKNNSNKIIVFHQNVF